MGLPLASATACTSLSLAAEHRLQLVYAPAEHIAFGEPSDLAGRLLFLLVWRFDSTSPPHDTRPLSRSHQ